MTSGCDYTDTAGMATRVAPARRDAARGGLPALPGRRQWAGRAALQLAVLLLLSLLSSSVFAQARAWLDRDRIAFGETVTLNIETESSAAPDYTPLQADFDISGRSSSRRVELGSGGMTSHTLHAVALRPRRDGVLTVPALTVGGATTAPLSLVVTPASTGAPARTGGDVFLESRPDDQDPYVQQAVGWVVRLYSAVPLVSGQLDQPSPDGASLRQVGDDAQYTRDIAGRRYTVIERRYLLIPERSGTVTVPGAVFEGRGATGFFDDLLGRRGELRAQAPPKVMEVRPAPADAPQPWLPLHGLQLRYQTTPQALHVGSAATLAVEAVADGASAAQMPELELPPIDGVQVFAEPVQADERFVDGRPQVTLTRRFSLVPTRGGEVTLAGLELDWWDVRSGQARTARLPELEWQVEGSAATPAPGGTGLPSPSAAFNGPATPAEPVDRAGRGWILATLLFAALWLFTLVWALQRRPPQLSREAAHAAGRPTHAGPGVDPAVLKRALATGDLGDVADALRALAGPGVRDIDGVRRRLADPDQRRAVEAMEQARWGGGDGPAARELLRRAFDRGPRWVSTRPPEPGPLAPLYPER
jgi:hypothetical protein